MRKQLIYLLILGSLATAAFAGDTKSLTGTIYKVKDKTVTVRKNSVWSKNTDSIPIEMDDATKTTGQLAPGLYIKVKYREEGGKKIAVEIETRPQYASKKAKNAPIEAPPPK
ncbi:MAG: hypothetical protein ACRD4K_07300 [Candidatus Acidiferrales bacterium]